MRESAGFLGAKIEQAKDFVSEKMEDKDVQKMKRYAADKVDEAKDFLSDKSQDAKNLARNAEGEAKRGYQKAKNYVSEKAGDTKELVEKAKDKS